MMVTVAPTAEDSAPQKKETSLHDLFRAAVAREGREHARTAAKVEKFSQLVREIQSAGIDVGFRLLSLQDMKAMGNIAVNQPEHVYGLLEINTLHHLVDFSPPERDKILVAVSNINKPNFIGHLPLSENNDTSSYKGDYKGEAFVLDRDGDRKALRDSIINMAAVMAVRNGLAESSAVPRSKASLDTGATSIKQGKIPLPGAGF